MKVPKGAEWMFQRSIKKTYERKKRLYEIKRQNRFPEFKMPKEAQEKLQGIGRMVQEATQSIDRRTLNAITETVMGVSERIANGNGCDTPREHGNNEDAVEEQ